MKLYKFIFSIGFSVALTFSASASDNNSTGCSQAETEQTKSKKQAYEEKRKKALEKYIDSRDESIAKYIAYRDSILGEFIKQMKRPWKEEESQAAAPKPIDESIDPEIVPEDEIIDFNIPEEEIAVTVVKDEPKVEPKKETKPEVKPEPKEEPKKETKPEVKPEPKVELKKETKPEVKLEPKVEPKKETKPEVKPEPKVELKKETKPKREVPKVKQLKREPQEVKIDKTFSLPDLTKINYPKPFLPEINIDKDIPETLEFDFYGTEIEAKIDERCKFKIKTMDNNGIAEAMESITKNNYLQSTLKDCIRIRSEYKLCDWAYLQMLQELSNAFFGGKCNEATLLTGYLYCMSGYKMRFAYNDNKELLILFASDQLVTSHPFVSIPSDGYRSYYSLTKGQNRLYICDFAFPQEKALSLYIREIPQLESDIKDFNLKFKVSKNSINYQVNKNLMDFFEKYPTPQTENDSYSKWSYYALTPLSDEAKATAYPSIKKLIDGKSDLAAVNMIMDWIESYDYGYDSKVWGFDRAFFPDETLYYPSSDCEDHAILLARLVNDLLGLETALIYYPGHLAAAVKFKEEVKGDYLLHNGQKYTVCDPTIYYAKAGTTMRSMRGKQATLILLNNGKK